jgi:hypothetical protein
MQAHAVSYEACERHGLIWIRPRDCDAKFPTFETEGYYHLGTLEHAAPVPLEVAFDNFCESEHTATTHLLFGYELDRMAEVTIEVEAEDDVVRAQSNGPHKPLPAWMRFAMGVGKDFGFHSEWWTRFSPVHMQVDHTLYNRKNQKEARFRYRAIVFCVPIDSVNTKIFTVVFTKSTWPGRYGGVRLFGPLVRRRARHEIDRDCSMLRGLADARPGLEGLKLSRFDRIMGLNRERIDRIYRGLSVSKPAGVQVTPLPNAAMSPISPTPGIAQSSPQ